MAMFLRRFFANPECDVATGGLRLKLPTGSSVVLWIELGRQLQDGLAHKMVNGFKGDSGVSTIRLLAEDDVVFLCTQG